MKKLQDLVVKERTFAVVDLGVEYGEHRFGTIDTKYITDGKLNTELNGLQMKLNSTGSGTIQSAKLEAITENYMSQGYEMLDAFKMALEDPEYLK